MPTRRKFGREFKGEAVQVTMVAGPTIWELAMVAIGFVKEIPAHVCKSC